MTLNQRCDNSLFEGRRKFSFTSGKGKVSQVRNDFWENSFTTYDERSGMMSIVDDLAGEKLRSRVTSSAVTGGNVSS